MDGFMAIYTKPSTQRVCSMYPILYPTLFKGYDGLGVSHRERQIEERNGQNFDNFANFIYYWDPDDVIYASCQKQCCG
jgi:hypothetical protein